nr:TaqI-like C-terminal specificity domain-containing protein [Candidatus Sigynarchaeota archaeon]
MVTCLGTEDVANTHELINNLVDDILVVYFLCDAGLVKVEGQMIPGSVLFSESCLNDGNFFRNFDAFVNLITGQTGAARMASIKSLESLPVDRMLFHAPLLGIVDTLKTAPWNEDWRAFFGFLNTLEWRCSEDTHGNSCPGESITPAILGAIHERDAGKPLDARANRKRTARLDAKSARKSKGVFYTPKDITRYISRRIIHGFILNRVSLSNDDLIAAIDRGSPEMLKAVLEIARDVKILDPACGTGEFLVTAASELCSIQANVLDRLGTIKKDTTMEIKKGILTRNIYGVDLGNKAIDIAKKRLYLWVCTEIKNGQVENGQKQVVRSLDHNLFAGNALIGWLNEDLGMQPVISPGSQAEAYTAINEALVKKLREIANQGDAVDCVNIAGYRPVHWRFDFDKIFKDRGGFDIIVGNPPYLFTRGKNFDEFEQSCFKTWCFQGYQTLVHGKARQAGKLNTFNLFIMRSLALLNEHGKLGFIVPNTILRTTTNDVIRQYLTERTFIEEIVDLQDGVFEGVTASTVILVASKMSSTGEKRSTIVKHDVHDLLSGNYFQHEVDQARFLENPACCFDIHVTPEFSTMFKVMKHNSFELRKISGEIIEGLVTRTSDDLFTSDSTNPMAKKLLRGKDIDKYDIHWRPGQFIIYDPKKLHRARPVKVHEASEKLLVQRIGGGTYPLRAAYDDKQYYFFASINAIILKNPAAFEGMTYFYKYILAILNSMLMNAYYVLCFSNKSSLTVNVSKTFLEILPIKKAPPTTQRTISMIADYLLFLHERYKNEKPFIERIDKDLLEPLMFELYLYQDHEPRLIDIVAKFLEPIDTESNDIDANLAIIKRVISHIENDHEFHARSSQIQAEPWVAITKKLFVERQKDFVD